MGLDSTVEALQKKAYERGLRDGARKFLTPKERAAVRGAIASRLAGEMEVEGDRAALHRALEKLQR